MHCKWLRSSCSEVQLRDGGVEHEGNGVVSSSREVKYACLCCGWQDATLTDVGSGDEEGEAEREAATAGGVHAK